MKIKILLLLLLSNVCFAQIKFETGYYKDNTGAVVNCLIKNKDWYKNPSFIEIKTSENDVVTKKTIAEITEFKVDGYSKYVRATVDIDDYVNDHTFLNNQPDPIISQKTVLLKVENEGDITLYSYNEENLQKFYFSKLKEPLTLLIFKKYYVDNNQIAQNNLYKQQLSSNLILTEELQRKLIKMSYNANDFNAFFEIINKNRDISKNSKINEKRKVINFNIKAGIVFNSYQSLINQNQISHFLFPAQTNFGFGFELEHILNFNKNKWSIYFEPFYESFESSTVGPQIGALNKTATVSLKILNLAAGVKHNMFISNNSLFFISAAVQVTSLIGNPNFFINSKELVMDENMFGFSASIGYKYKKIILEYRIRANQDWTDLYDFYPSNYTSSALVLGYTVF